MQTATDRTDLMSRVGRQVSCALQHHLACASVFARDLDTASMRARFLLSRLAGERVDMRVCVLTPSLRARLHRCR